MAIATCIQAPTRIERRTVDNAVAIPKGTIMKLTTPNTAIASTADNDPFAGIAVEEKTASDGITEIGCAMDGRWSMTTTAAGIGIGVPCVIGGANAIRAGVEADTVLGNWIGKNLTTIGGGGGTAIVEVGGIV